MKFAVCIFKFFASLRLAVFLLLALAAVFAIGTFVESIHSAEAAKLAVYASPWMTLLLILLALNVLAAALDRLPWKKKHTGFVITHAGILLILAGSLVTRAWGIEGQIPIAEGETQSRMILSEPMLQASSVGTRHALPAGRQGVPLQRGSYTIPPRAFPWKGREELTSVGPQPLRIFLLRSYPKSSRKEKIAPTTNGPSALKVVLQSSWMKVNHWLVLDDAERSQISLGPAKLRFTREPLALERGFEGQGFLEFHFENSSVGERQASPLQIPVPEKVPQTRILEGTPYRVTIERVLRDARVDEGKLVDQSEEWNNPAVELVLEGPGFEEKHTAFSQFPDFPTMHGIEPSETGVRIDYRRPSGGRPQNELRFLWQETGPPHYQVRKGEALSEGEVEIRKDYETGWMDFKFRVEAYHPHAQVAAEFLEEPVSSQAEDHFSAIQIELEREGEKKILWLGQGDRKGIKVGGEAFEIIYGLKTHPVGFRLKLRDFRVEPYPGTNRPASFESDVTLVDDFKGSSRDLKISMNQPLTYRGFKVFQSGYQQVPGEPEISIFTVAKDPGIPLKYSGAVVLIGGIVTMFYSRRFSIRGQGVRS